MSVRRYMRLSTTTSPIWKDTAYSSSERSPGLKELLALTLNWDSARVTVPALFVAVMVRVYSPALRRLKAQALSSFHRS